MIPKILTGVALAFAVIALILKLVAVSVPHFVDVHFIRDIDDLSDDNVIAGVGVYNSIYDPTGENIAQTVADEGLPPDIIESGTLDFVLLFPSQLNFQAQLLPVAQADAANLDALLGSGQDVQDSIVPAIEGVENVVFENCETYTVEALGAGQVYFNALEDELLPTAVAAITGTIADGLNFGTDGTDGLTALQGGIVQAASAAAIVGEAFILAAVAAAIEFVDSNCIAVLDGEELDLTVTMDVARACIANGGPLVQGSFDAIPLVRSSQLIQHFVAVTTNAAVFNDQATLGQALQTAQGTVAFDVAVNDGGALNAAPEFVVDFGVQICGDVFSCVTKLEYLGEVVALLGEQVEAAGAEGQAAAGALQAYISFVGTAVIAVTDTFLDEFEAVASLKQEAEFPATFALPYQPCEIIDQFHVLQPGFELFQGNATCDSFRVFLPTIFDLLTKLENPLAGLVGEIVETYQICDAAGAPFGNIIGGFCAELFAAGTISATPGVDPQSQTFGQDLIDACEDDETDRDAVATAQVLVGFSAALNVVTVIVIIVSFFVLPKVVGPVGAATAILGGIFIISGLLVVRGAPVYEGVGEEPDGENFDAIFVEGYVALLALVDALLSFLAGGLLVAAAITSCFCDGESSDYDDDADKKDVDVVEDQL